MYRLKSFSIIAARLALFAIYFWFGLLKILGLSPAGPMVESLFNQTLALYISFHLFYLGFAGLECLIGILFLIPKATRIALILFFLHMITTTLPLILLSDITWQAMMVPTLEGQYIIKNIALIALALEISASRR